MQQGFNQGQPEKIFQRESLTTSSLDAPVNGEEGRSFLGDLIADSSLEEPLDMVEQRIHHEQLGRWLSHLSEQEQHLSLIHI
mgnify:CR=1 FL=1